MIPYEGIGATEEHAGLIIASYRKWTGKALIQLRPGESAARQLFEAPQVVLSHGVEEDPVLNYGNLSAMREWEMDWETFTRTPSRYTAEPMEREERSKFLSAVAEHGYVDCYTGIRIASSGRRFYIVNATVWNLIDESGVYRGQAATFAETRRL